MNFYYLVFIRLIFGRPYEHLEEQLEEFERIENYEACEEIKRALKLANFYQ